jgi:hypothetical protein
MRPWPPARWTAGVGLSRQGRRRGRRATKRNKYPRSPIPVKVPGPIGALARRRRRVRGVALIICHCLAFFRLRGGGLALPVKALLFFARHPALLYKRTTSDRWTRTCVVAVAVAHRVGQTPRLPVMPLEARLLSRTVIAREAPSSSYQYAGLRPLNVESAPDDSAAPPSLFLCPLSCKHGSVSIVQQRPRSARLRRPLTSSWTPLWSCTSQST